MEEITKEEVKKLMEIDGQARGAVFKTDADYVLAEKGEEGLRKVEEELGRLGCPLNYKKINNMEFYPLGLRAVSLLAIKKALNFDDGKIKDMGLVATKKSLIIKLFVRYFLSVKRVFFEESPRIWQKHWTKGTLVPIELDEGKKYALLRLKDFNLHSLYCSVYLCGYFSGILQMLIKTTEITCQEVKCPFEGDEYHEYLLKWK